MRIVQKLDCTINVVEGEDTEHPIRTILATWKHRSDLLKNGNDISVRCLDKLVSKKSTTWIVDFNSLTSTPFGFPVVPEL